MAVWVFGFGVSRTFWGFGLEKIGDLEIFGAGLWGPALGLRAWASVLAVAWLFGFVGSVGYVAIFPRDGFSGFGSSGLRGTPVGLFGWMRFRREGFGGECEGLPGLPAFCR